MEAANHGAIWVQCAPTVFIGWTHDANGFCVVFCLRHGLDELLCIFSDFFFQDRAQGFKSMAKIGTFHVGVVKKQGGTAVVLAPIAGESVFCCGGVPGGIHFFIQVNETGKSVDFCHGISQGVKAWWVITTGLGNNMVHFGVGPGLGC